QSTRANFTVQFLRGFLRGEGDAVRSRLDHRVVRVSRGQDTGGERVGRARSCAVVARAIQSFVMLRCQRTKALQWLRTSQHAIRIVRVQADLLPFALRKHPFFAPDAGGHTDAPEVM